MEYERKRLDKLIKFYKDTSNKKYKRKISRKLKLLSFLFVKRKLPSLYFIEFFKEDILKYSEEFDLFKNKSIKITIGKLKDTN